MFFRQDNLTDLHHGPVNQNILSAGVAVCLSPPDIWCSIPSKAKAWPSWLATIAHEWCHIVGTGAPTRKQPWEAERKAKLLSVCVSLARVGSGGRAAGRPIFRQPSVAKAGKRPDSLHTPFSRFEHRLAAETALL